MRHLAAALLAALLVLLALLLPPPVRTSATAPVRWPEPSVYATTAYDPFAGAVRLTPVSEPSTAPVQAPRRAITGVGTWYGAAGLIAAAGPALRRWLGTGWRGTRVRVTAGGRSVVVVLADWCACGSRNGVPTVLDLSDDAFLRLAPLSQGVLKVTVTRA